MSNKLLLVEDNNGVREVLSLLFAAHSYLVTECKDGNSAVECIQNDTFDVAIIDVGLPDISGYRVAAELRRTELVTQSGQNDSNEAILVALTARSTKPTRRDVFAAGFDIHFAKPAQVREICEEIESVKDKRHTIPMSGSRVA